MFSLRFREQKFVTDEIQQAVSCRKCMPLKIGAILDIYDVTNMDLINVIVFMKIFLPRKKIWCITI